MMKKFRKAAVIAAAAVMAFSLMMPAAAMAAGVPKVEDGTTAGGAVKNPVTDPGAERTSVVLNKFVTADPDATIPQRTFTFSAAELGIGNASVTTDMPALSITDITSTGSQKTAEEGVYYQTGDLHANTVKVGSSTIDLTKAAWPHAGVYRYYITETNTAAAGEDWAYMTDGNTGYELSVYVVNGTGAKPEGNGIPVNSVGVQYAVVNKATVPAGETPTDANVTAGDKVDASAASESNTNGDGFEFTNTYTPEVALEINKKITGNAADMTKVFSFTLSNLQIPAVTDLVKAPGDQQYHFTATTDADPAISPANGTTVITGIDFSFKLGHDDKLTIADLPVGTTYQITETGETNYTATYMVTEGGTALTAQTGTVAADAVSNGTIKSTAAARDTENIDAYTNDYTVTTPTGIILDHMPAFLAIGGALILGIVVIVLKRKRER